LCIVLGCFFSYKNFAGIERLPVTYWLAVAIMLIAGIFYYGLLPKSFFKINLRNTGLLKAFVIGFVWACCANILSFIVVQIESGPHRAELIFLGWLFFKNWMFCTVNAMIFDIKDYEDDSNRQLKTFAVAFWNKKYHLFYFAAAHSHRSFFFNCFYSLIVIPALSPFSLILFLLFYCSS
jgi:4-hydroxybenzoate polyprenyltransferase